jgi:hypothetical protein
MSTEKKKYSIEKKMLQTQGFTIAAKDETRPWGGFFVIDENQAQDFANQYFDGIDVENLRIGGS